MRLTLVLYSSISRETNHARPRATHGLMSNHSEPWAGQRKSGFLAWEESGELMPSGKQHFCELGCELIKIGPLLNNHARFRPSTFVFAKLRSRKGAATSAASPTGKRT